MPRPDNRTSDHEYERLNPGASADSPQKQPSSKGEPTLPGSQNSDLKGAKRDRSHAVWGPNGRTGQEPLRPYANEGSRQLNTPRYTEPFVGPRRSLEMPSQDARLNELLRAFESTGREYIAQSLAVAVKSTLSAGRSPASEIAATTVAKANWDAAEKALTKYQLGRP